MEIREALIIVHACDSLLEKHRHAPSCQGLKERIRERIKLYSGKGRIILYTPFSRTEDALPQYLGEDGRSVQIVKLNLGSGFVSNFVRRQALRCREILDDNHIKHYEIGGLYRHCCVSATKHDIDSKGNGHNIPHGHHPIGFFNQHICNDVDFFPQTTTITRTIK